MKIALLTTALLLLIPQLKSGNIPATIAIILLFVLWFVDFYKHLK